MLLAACVLLTMAVPAQATASRWFHNVSSTAYSACDSGTLTAAGTQTRPFRTVAQNTLPFFTLIKVVKPRGGVFGRHYWTVEDHIGAFSDLDFNLPCSKTNVWGRRSVTYRVVRYGK